MLCKIKKQEKDLFIYKIIFLKIIYIRINIKSLKYNNHGCSYIG
jgi:hypothetical protein